MKNPRVIAMKEGVEIMHKNVEALKDDLSTHAKRARAISAVIDALQRISSHITYVKTGDEWSVTVAHVSGSIRSVMPTLGEALDDVLEGLTARIEEAALATTRVLLQAQAIQELKEVTALERVVMLPGVGYLEVGKGAGGYYGSLCVLDALSSSTGQYTPVEGFPLAVADKGDVKEVMQRLWAMFQKVAPDLIAHQQARLKDMDKQLEIIGGARRALTQLESSP